MYNEIINEIIAKQTELAEIVAKMGEYNRNASNDGCKARTEAIAKIRNITKEIEQLNEQL